MGGERRPASLPNGVPPSISLITGWCAITSHVSARTGFAISEDSIKRWSQRRHDPLPIRKWGAGRPRVIADGHELDAWCDRQWVSTERGEQEHHVSGNIQGEKHLQLAAR
jgi:hypothetical protein